jgi:peptidoglycan-N-acetylglucosamine deacetylase
MYSSLATGLTVGLSSTVALMGLAAGGAWAAMGPGSQLFGRTLTAPPRPGELALTFDDGPNPAHTPRLLDILAEHDVRATFFLVGRYAQAAPSLVRRIADAGHLIGNHSWSHPNLAFISATRIEDELRRTSETLADLTGKPVRFFRPPFGGRRPFVLCTARELGMIPVMWNAITTDWSEPSASRIASRMMSKIDRNQHRGYATNIVLHDGGHRELGANRGPSVDAVAQLLARYRHTHTFVTVDVWPSPA